MVEDGHARSYEAWLTGARIVVDERMLARWARVLFHAAAPSASAAGLARLTEAPAGAMGAVAEAALEGDPARLAAQAGRHGAGAAALVAVAPLLVTPLLRATPAVAPEPT